MQTPYQPTVIVQAPQELPVVQPLPPAITCRGCPTWGALLLTIVGIAVGAYSGHELTKHFIKRNFQLTPKDMEEARTQKVPHLPAKPLFINGGGVRAVDGESAKYLGVNKERSVCIDLVCPEAAQEPTMRLVLEFNDPALMKGFARADFKCGTLWVAHRKAEGWPGWEVFPVPGSEP